MTTESAKAKQSGPGGGPALPALNVPRPQIPEQLSGVEQVQSVRTPIRLEYKFIPGKAAQAYLEAFKEKKILGHRSPVDGAVFVPPRGVDPRYGVATTEYVELPARGHIGSFCVTEVPIPGRDDLKLPYISAWIFLDGADIGFIGLVGECEPADCRIGMRVEAVWKEEISSTAENIRWWKPTGEEDVPFSKAGGRGFLWRQNQDANTAHNNPATNNPATSNPASK